MKKRLQLSGLLMAFVMFASMNLLAQTYHFQEGFVEGAAPAGWSVKDVSYSSAASNAANMVITDALYCAKMKTNNIDAWLQAPKVNGAGTLSFWCKVKDGSIGTHIKIQTSDDEGVTWVDVASDPVEINLTLDTEFQNYSLDINQAGGVIIRIYVTSDTPGTNSTGTLTVDDIQLTTIAAAADDASLTNLILNGSPFPGFVYDTYTYQHEFWFGAQEWVIEAVPNNSNATVDITQATSIDGSEAERTATVTVTSEDQSTTQDYTVVFSESPYVFATGCVKTGDGAFDDDSWETAFSWQSTNIPGPGNHGDLAGDAAYKFVRGQEDKAGYLVSPKLANIGTLSFWMFVQASDGAESLQVKKQTGFAMATTILDITANDINEDTWTKFEVVIDEPDSTVLTFTPSLTAEGATRLWMDDLIITGTLVSSKAKLAGSPAVSVYPNPSSDYLNMMIPGSSYDRFELINMLGQVVMDRKIDASNMRVNVSDLEGGIYMLSFTGKAGRYATKFIRE